MQRRRLLLKALLCVLSAFLFYQFTAVAQTPDVQVWFPIQDGVKLDLVNDDAGITHDSNQVWAYYEFQLRYDDHNVLYTFTGLNMGGKRIHLANWKLRETTRALDAAGLSAISRSKTFTLVGGDTLQFYRELAWADPNNPPYYQLPDNFYSRDTVEWVVELMDATTNTRIARLDSLGVLRQVPGGYPHVYGNGPALHIPRYEIPTSKNGTAAYVRIRIGMRGDGEYYPKRYDDYGIGLSKTVTDSCFTPLFAVLNAPATKQNIRELQRAETRGVLKAEVLSKGREVQISINESNLAGMPLWFAIYDLAGNREYIASWIGQEEGLVRTIQYSFPTRGAYILGLYNGKEVYDVTKIIIP